ncbi:Tektin-3, partial [Gryllus bimaculatus]
SRDVFDHVSRSTSIFTVHGRRPGQPVTNALVDACYTPKGMVTEPLRFPNLVTGFDRNPDHAARTALYTRYTPYEWTQNIISHFNEADTSRNYSERHRNDAMRVIRETEEKTASGQRESGRRLGERLTDTTFWRNELATELERLLGETNLLQDKRRDLEKAIQDIEGPMHIAKECLYQRENRIGIDLVHDQAEQALLKEVDTFRNCQERLRSLHERALAQLRNNRAAQHDLERDVKSKESALGIDSVQQEIFDVEKNIELLRKAIQDKSNPLKVAQTRLETRAHRRDVELCRDGPQA